MKTVLVVDDDEGIRLSLKDFLDMSGYDVWTAASGREALDLIERINKPCLVLLDVKLPDESGLSILEKIRASFNDSVEVVLMTALTKVPSRPAQVMFKPFDIDILAKVVVGAWGDLSIRTGT